MKKFIICIALLLTVTSMSGCSVINYILGSTESEQTETETEPFTYEGVTLDLPVGFEIKKQDEGGLNAHRLEQPDINEMLTMAKIEGSSEPLSQETIQKNLMEPLADYADNISEMRDFTEYEIDGYAVQKFKYDYTLDGITINCIQDIIYLDDYAVLITVGATNSKCFSEMEIANSTIRVEG